MQTVPAFRKNPFSLVFFSLSCLLLMKCVDAEEICCGFERVADKELFGKWQLVEQKIGIGPPGEWMDGDDGHTYTFNRDYSFADSENPSCPGGSFEIKGDTLMLHYKCIEGNKTWDYRMVEFDGSSMTLEPASVFCIEGCSFRYQKLQ